MKSSNNYQLLNFDKCNSLTDILLLIERTDQAMLLEIPIFNLGTYYDISE